MLNLSVPVCLVGSLHDYVTLLQVHHIVLDPHDGVPHYVSSSCFFLKAKNEITENMTRTLSREMFISTHIR